MGLDTVELVMEIENAFSVSIPDDEAGQMQTAGDVFQYLLANVDVDVSSKSSCLSAATFYALRSAARELGATDRLRPGDSTEILFPESNRRIFWAKLQEASGLRLPALCRPEWMVSTGLLTAFAFAALCGVYVFRLTDSVAAMCVVATLAGLAIFAVLEKLSRLHAVHPSWKIPRLRELAQIALSLNYANISKRCDATSEKDVWLALKGLIGYQLGVPTEAITPDSHFVHDLGCD